MKNRRLAYALVLVAVMLLSRGVWSHCEIPCGIYDDELRYDLLEEHITTIEKSMDMAVQLSAEGDKNYNQLVRWVVNKEDHANKFMEIVTQYFLTQRIKPAGSDAGDEYEYYITQVSLMHRMLVSAMKCKQTTDKSHVEKLRELVAESRKLYFEKHGHEH